MRLHVELSGQFIGELSGDERTFDFTPARTAIDHFGVGSRALSVAMPFVARPNRAHSSRRRNFFEELLPEGDQLEFMLAMAGLRRRDTLAFLARFGRDIAGALQIWDADNPTEPQTPEARPVSEEDVHVLLTERAANPLANSGVLGKTSLAGVQPKIVLAHLNGGWHQVFGGFPSTHIVKPIVSSRPTEIFDEEYGARFTRALGIANFDTHLANFGGTDALVIQRFDRDLAVPGGRVHQEDFNQVLGAARNQKYQAYGGIVNLKRIAEVLRTHGQAHDMRKLAVITTLGVVISNLDMHAKNLGLLHYADGHIALAPAYDFVPHGLREGLDGQLALAVNKKYLHATVTKDDLVLEFSSWGLRGTKDIVNDTLEQVQVIAAREEPVTQAAPGLAENASATVQHLLDGRAAGAMEIGS
ncbi:type II toxin-antitoxin system HipA family toxin [Arthrobacter psychrochitiniphilus]|uniref:Type II toxin-antitoxin system HipA family toxin n=1 Tax=Arthrobacter psychrochitiniphilus TaxID=291045 RepID=A0A2V3DMA8_9MICC|nr:HipA domain-containing protein [Arthrobacter psychrochitiniphilus]NYG17439.1 serine/threonine-protein kinase HipA [Arthrobacter psychrochitiniphilus]PXA64073.1 type II toxin-antitoxin system HipA family toxin [Arthrobacter psychrochitiniphilus]